MRYFGRWLWSKSEKDELERLSDAITDANKEVEKQWPVMNKFWKDAREKYGKHEHFLMRDPELMDEVDRKELAKLKSEEKELVADRHTALHNINKFLIDMDKKYKEGQDKRKALAEEAMKSPVHEKMKYAPPRGDLPGGPGYEEAKASFGKGRTRRRRARRHTRKH